jgi:hypothetical protein
MALLAFQAHTRVIEGTVEGKRSSQDSSGGGHRPTDGGHRFSGAGTTQPTVVTEFEVRERDVALRIRVERWPSPADASDDDTLIEAGYGHGV